MEFIRSAFGEESVTAVSDAADELQEKIRSRQAQLGVIGLGYVGLPLATEFARNGFRVAGIDLDPQKVARINDGQSYIADVPSSDVARLVEQGLLRATEDYR